MTTQSSNGHSAIVRITLRIGGQTVGVSQMGPDFLILKESFGSKARNAVVVLTVDGVAEEIPVHLPAGISPTSTRIAIAEVEAGALALA